MRTDGPNEKTRTMRAERCGRCRYYVDTERGRGQCRLDPPVPVVVVDRGQRIDEPLRTKPINVFPMVDEAEWCGQFASR